MNFEDAYGQPIKKQHSIDTFTRVKYLFMQGKEEEATSLMLSKLSEMPLDLQNTIHKGFAEFFPKTGKTKQYDINGNPYYDISVLAEELKVDKKDCINKAEELGGTAYKGNLYRGDN